MKRYFPVLNINLNVLIILKTIVLAVKNQLLVREAHRGEGKSTTKRLTSV